MDFPKIDLSKKRNKAKSVRIKLIGLALLFVIIVFFLLKTSTKDADFNFIFNTGPNLKNNDGIVNVLLLGIGGENHDGPYLTDTVMVASVNTKTHETNLISIPRDLWLGSIKGKVNSAYTIGLRKNAGLPYTEGVVGKVLGIPIQYGFRIDFGGFVKAVDDVEGIDVTVDRALDDYLYPVEGKENDLCGWQQVERDFSPEDAAKLNIPPGKRQVLVMDDKIATDSADEAIGDRYFSCRFEHIHFDKGLTHMDGTTALKFVRSRHGLGVEGSDFARSARQQKVLDAVRTKALSLETLANPTKISSLLATFGNSIDTDFKVTDMLELYKIVKNNKATNSFVVNGVGKTPLLINPPPGDYGGWVLIPKAGADNFSEIQAYVKDIITGGINEATASARIR